MQAIFLPSITFFFFPKLTVVFKPVISVLRVFKLLNDSVVIENIGPLCPGVGDGES